MRLMGAGRLAGPIDARVLVLMWPFVPAGAGEGLGLVDGGRRDIAFYLPTNQSDNEKLKKKSGGFGSTPWSSKYVASSRNKLVKEECGIFRTKNGSGGCGLMS